jgi:hypothetical protein
MSGGILIAWMIAIGFSAWNSGFRPGGKDGKSSPEWPPPYVFLDPTILFLGLSFLGRWQPRIANLLAFGLIVPLVLVELQRKGSPFLTLPLFQGTGQTPAQQLGQANVQYPTIASLQFESPIQGTFTNPPPPNMPISNQQQ